MTDVETNTPGSRPASFTILDRVIPVKPMSTMTQGQGLGLYKILQRQLYGGVNGAMMAKLDHALSKLLEPADNEWLEWQIMEGAVEWTTVLMEIMPCLRADDGVPEKAPAKKAAKARKAVAKKAPAKKAPAKKAAPKRA